MKTNHLGRLHASRAAVFFFAALIAAFAARPARATNTINTSGTFNFEAASMSPAGTGATVSTSSDPNVTGGLLEFLNSTGVGQSMTLTTPSIPAGTYQVQFRYKTNTTRGQHTVTIDGTPIGGTIDQYATTPAYPTATMGTVTFATTGSHTIVLTVTGKDASATHFYITADKFAFISLGGEPQAAAPVFSPGGGTFFSAQTVTITSATGSASINYTTDGSMPTETNGTLYSGPVSISSTTVLQAIAFETGFTDSPVASATYTITPPLTPIFSPPGGTFTSAQSVTITSAGAATIYYTTDGTVPTASSTLYAGAIEVTINTVLQAMGVNSGGTSSVAIANYTILQPAAAPTFTPPGGIYSSAQTVTITDGITGPGAPQIRYTTDGSTPTETNGTLYSGAVNISATATLQAIAYGTGFTDSPVASATYTISTGGTFNFEAASMSPVGAGATVSTSSDPNVTGGLLEFLNSTAAGQSMTLTTPSMPAGTYQVQFRYKTNTTRGQHTVTIDGTQIGGTIDQYATTATYPTVTLGNVTFTTTGSHAIVLTVTGKDTAATHFYITADKFTFILQGGEPQAAAPVFSPGGGTYTSAQTVTITSATGSASINYTTDGSTPTETNGTLYSGPVRISSTTVLQAIAFETAFTDSPVASATYTFAPPLTPVFSPPGGGPSTTITSLGATAIYYTIDGSIPTTSSTLYTGPLAIASNTVLQAIGVNSGGSSPIGTLIIPPPPPVFNPVPGTYANVTTISVTISDAVNATIYYTTDGSTPTAGSTPYTPAVPLPVGTTTLKAIAVTAIGSSAVTAGTYILTPPPPLSPIFSPAGGTFTSPQSVTITSPGATAIYYTTNGTIPTTASILYTGPVTIANSTVLEAVGANSAGTSSVATAAFTIAPPDFSLSVTSASPTVLLGESTSCTITSIPVNGFKGIVSLGATGLPSGVTGAFSPVTITGAGNSTLTISASGSAPTGTYTLTITGTCSSPSASFVIPVTLNVSTNSSLQQAITAVGQMSLAEEISQVHGSEDATSIRYIPASAHAPQYNFTNGPAGIGNGGPGHEGNATAMPAPIALAATFDVNMAQLYGIIVGQEAVDYSNDMIEGPDINIARVPQNGRTFEAYGEDPYLVGQMAVNEIEGIQAQGISAESKHFAGNNQETNRMSINDIIDERTLREIYLPAFEATVLQGHVDAVMGAYNRVNGQFCCENMTLLHDILKGEWGFAGYTTSDFGATQSTVASALAGLDAEMPTAVYYGSALQTAVTANKVPKPVLDEMLIRRFSTMISRGVFHAPRPNTPIPAAADGAVAREVAEAGMVLLQNNGGTLPLQIPQLQSIALIGPFATSAMTGGGGSSHVTPLYTVTPLAGIQTRVAGTGITVQLNDGSNVASAVALAQSSTVAIVMVGDNEKEGVDDSISLSGNGYPNQDALVEAVAAANPHTVVVLKTGTAVLMPWANQVPAILEAWYPGEEDGNAVAAVLFGDVNPSGKLPLTFPANVSDCPANTPAQYPGVNGTATYSEGIFVGYRHYDASNLAPLFPFGHGLSYTTFQYQNLAINPATTSFVGNPGQTVSVDLDIANSGPVAGNEVAQIYVGKPALPNGLQDAPQWLKGFEKISVAPGQTGHVHVVLNLRSFAYWDVTTHAWLVAPGNYSIYVGSSSRDIRLVGQVTIN